MSARAWASAGLLLGLLVLGGACTATPIQLPSAELGPLVGIDEGSARLMESGPDAPAPRDAAEGSPAPAPDGRTDGARDARPGERSPADSRSDHP